MAKDIAEQFTSLSEPLVKQFKLNEVMPSVMDMESDKFKVNPESIICDHSGLASAASMAHSTKLDISGIKKAINVQTTLSTGKYY